MDEDICVICYDIIDNNLLCKTNCNHIYCKVCLHKWFDRGNINCPMCRIPIKSYFNNDTNNMIILLKPVKTIVNIRTNFFDRNIIEYYQTKIKKMNYLFFFSISYICYLNYKNYIYYNQLIGKSITT